MTATCQKCGGYLEPNARFCNVCGSPAIPGSTSRKSKTVSELLAVFLFYWTWLYTYKRDGWKFWLAFVLSGLPILIVTIFMVFYVSDVSWLPDNLLIGLSYGLPMAFWVLAIFDTLRKNQQWYDNY